MPEPCQVDPRPTGSLRVTDVASVSLDDGSGSARIANVAGDVRVTDGSGSVDVRQIGGSVVIDDDGSGSIEIREVGGDTAIEP